MTPRIKPKRPSDRTQRKLSLPARNRTKSPAVISKTISTRSCVEWIRELASPYLKAYSPTAANENGLQGFWFTAGFTSERRSKRTRNARAARPQQIGFFIGYLNEASAKYSFLKLESPECVVFAWISPANGELHKRLVREQGSLVRKTFDYIRWLTHRPPRFVFHENEEAAMARHASMKDWPIAKREHLSRNFFIETLCWLVRSGLVRKLREEAALNQDHLADRG